MAIEQVGGVGSTLTLGWSPSTTTTNIPLEVGSAQIVAGDLVILSVVYSSSTAPSTTAPTLSVWGHTATQLGTWQTYGTQRYVGTFYFIFNGRVNTNSTSVYATVTIPATANHCMLTTSVWRGVDQTTPIDATTTETVTSSGTSHVMPSITTVTDGAVVVSTIGASNDNGAGGSVFSSVSSGWGLIRSNGTTLGNDGSAAHSYKTMPTAGATGTATYTTSAAVTCGGQVVALRPASTTLPASTHFVGRGAVQVTTTTGGWTKTTSDPEAQTARGPLTAQTGDLAVVFAWQNDTGAAVFTAPSGWTSVISQDYGNTTLQVYVTPWVSGLTWPSWTAAATVDRFVTYGLILRGIDTSNPINTSSNSDVTTASTTVTMPAVTPSANDCILIRGAFLQNDNYITTDPASGQVILSADALINTSLSAAGADQATFLILDALSGGSGVSTGTVAVTQSLSNVYTAFTVAFNKKVAATVQRTASDTGTGSESAAGNIIFSRTASDSATGTESADGAKVSVVSRTASDSGTGTESASGLVTRVRTASDSATGTESATRAVTFRKTASDSGTGSESTSINLIRRRTASDEALGSSTAVGNRTTFATASDTGTGSESAVSRHVHRRTANDSGLGTETAEDTHRHVRSASDSGTGTESATRIIIISRTATGSGDGTESAAGLITRFRTASDTGTGTESATGVRIAFRTATGSGLGEESASSDTFATVRKTASDSATGSESASWLLTAKRTASDSTTGSESATGVRAVSRTATGEGTGSESSDGQHIHQRSVSDSGTGTESATWQGTLARTISDSVTGSSTAASRHVHVRTVNDSGLGTQTADGGFGSTTKQRTAEGAGTGTESSSFTHKHQRTANAQALGTESGVCVRRVLRTSTDYGTGSETVSSRRICTRTATAAGTSSESAFWGSVSGAYFGSFQINAVKAGTTNVSRIYVGATRVWN